ncbi:MAG: helix-turn-helix transcriptional regulator [Dysosmobacter sp.]
MDYIDIMIDIRKEENITQQELAKKLGWSRPQIARYETRTSTPTIDYLIAFCRAMKVNPDRILYNELKGEKDG